MTVLAATPEPTLAPTGVVEVSVDELRVGPSMRERGVDPSHVATLAEVADDWPPIVVNRSDRFVVDGQHRVAAAKQLGRRQLRAVWFDGSREDNYLEFVRRNVSHGLPLTLAERRRAARRIVTSRPDLSDRGIAAVCGLSPRTVARLREEIGTTAAGTNGSGPKKGRVGRDGRVRPIDPAAARARIAEEIARHPDASLRKIASVVGASPETVRSVRNQVRASHSSPAGEAEQPEATVLGLLSRSRNAHAGVACREDRAFMDRANGPEFAEWFDSTSVEQGELWQYVDAVPLSRVYEIADEARRRADFWSRFAVAIEARVRRRA
jgi:ParB-like chromosome segregation protein Spo0J